MRLLFIGDVVGRTGRAAISEHVPVLRRKLALDFVVANGENAAGGFGITEHIAQEFLNAGVDCITLGNHSFDQREALVFIERRAACAAAAQLSAGHAGARRLAV